MLTSPSWVGQVDETSRARQLPMSKMARQSFHILSQRPSLVLVQGTIILSSSWHSLYTWTQTFHFAPHPSLLPLVNYVALWLPWHSEAFTPPSTGMRLGSLSTQKSVLWSCEIEQDHFIHNWSISLATEVDLRPTSWSTLEMGLFRDS